MSKRQWFDEDIDSLLTPMTQSLAVGIAIGLVVIVIIAIVMSLL